MAGFDTFESFMRAYQDMVYSLAIRLLGQEADAQDVAQEVFLRAYNRYADLSQSPTAGGWLKTVTRNLCLNHLTRYRNRWRFFSELSRDDDGDELPWDVPVEESTGAAMSEADQRQVLEVALRKLPSAQRVPLVLYHFEEMSYEDIAAQMKISLAKVKTDIFRARESLRKKLRVSMETGEVMGREEAAGRGH